MREMRIQTLLFIVVTFPAIFGHHSLAQIVKNEYNNLNISDKCKEALTMYNKNLEEDTDDNWALQMLDATSKMPVGLLSYNFGEMGNFEQCIQAKSKNGAITGKYCLGHISIKNESAEFKVSNQQLIWKHILDAITPGTKTLGPTWAVCLPSDCSDEDILTILEPSESIGLEFSSINCQTYEDANPTLDAPAILAIVILLSLIFLMVFCTSYDVFCIRNNKKPVHGILTIFSVYTNGKKLFTINRASKDLSCLHGIRVLSMLWIMCAHTFSIYPNGPIFNSKDFLGISNNAGSMLFATATIACDTFLLIGGALIVYVFLKQSPNETFKINLPLYYFHRYLRITPAMAGMVLVSGTLLKYLGSGPNWVYVKESFQGFCEDYWWSSLLYIQNYVNVSEMCVGHSWYLNVDWQLYLISPIFLYLLTKYPKIGIGLISLLSLASIAASFYISYSNDLFAIIISQNQTAAADNYMNDYYLRTHTRASPWLIGLILGYFLFKYRDVPKINKKIIFFIWVLCLVALALCTFGGYGTLTGSNYDRLGNAFHIALVRPTWAICLSWIVWACVSGYGGIINTLLSLSIFQVFSKFTYSMYLLHVTLLYLIVYSSKISIYMSIFTLFHNFLAIVMLTFCLSLFWVLAFESPALALEKVILNKKH